MIQLQVRYARFGDLVLKRTSGAAFEVIRLLDRDRGAAVARVAVEQKGEFPALSVTRLDNAPRTLERAPVPMSDRIVLADCREGAPHCYRLTAQQEGDCLAIILSGDSRTAAGRHHFQMFWWRVEFSLSRGELIVRGPSLAADSWS